MALQFAVGNATTGATAIVAEGGSIGLLEIHDGDVINFTARGGNPNKMIDLQKSPNGTSWTNWLSTRADGNGDVAGVWTLNEPTPAPAVEYYRVVSRIT